MKIAVVAGGWHWPAHFYRELARQSRGADLFVVAHRNPELPIVRTEKLDLLAAAPGALGAADRMLYAEYPTISQLVALGWKYSEAPNTVGDWGFLNQWLEQNDFRRYDVILNCHDDTFIRAPGLFDQLAGDWLILSNGTYPEAPQAYVRGSFEFWKREMLEMLGGRIDLGPLTLTREGQIDTPSGAGLEALSAWNDTASPVRRFMVNRGLSGRVSRLSGHYRVSRWVIECERGFLHWRGGAPWSFDAGIEAFPLEAGAD